MAAGSKLVVWEDHAWFKEDKLLLDISLQTYCPSLTYCSKIFQSWHTQANFKKSLVNYSSLCYKHKMEYLDFLSQNSGLHLLLLSASLIRAVFIYLPQRLYN